MFLRFSSTKTPDRSTTKPLWTRPSWHPLAPTEMRSGEQ